MSGGRALSSIRLLCDRFMAMHESIGSNELLMAREMFRDFDSNTRRIRELLKLLQYIGVIRRVAPNRYYFLGKDGYQWTAMKLKAEAMLADTHYDPETTWVVERGVAPQGSIVLLSMNAYATLVPNTGTKSIIERFMQVLLLAASRNQAVTLRRAQQTLSMTEHVVDTRRLYEIANVLESIGLVEKLAVCDPIHGRVAAFKWLASVAAEDIFPSTMKLQIPTFNMVACTPLYDGARLSRQQVDAARHRKSVMLDITQSPYYKAFQISLAKKQERLAAKQLLQLKSNT